MSGTEIHHHIMTSSDGLGRKVKKGLQVVQSGEFLRREKELRALSMGNYVGGDF